MTVRAFGVGKPRGRGRLALAGLLMTTTALVLAPKVEAAGVIFDPSRLDLQWRYVGIPALSADGTMFVGNVHDTLNSLFTAYHDPGTGTTSASGFGGSTAAYGMTGDGRYVVGLSEMPGGGDRAFRWDTEAGMMLNLGLLDPGNPLGESYANDISGGGETVVGGYFRPGALRAFAWIDGATTGEVGNEQMYQLKGLASASRWYATSISDTGRYATGGSNGTINGFATASLAVRWDLSGLEAGGTGSDVLLNLGSLTGVDGGYSVGHDISADGRMVVGAAADESGFSKAFRWVEGSTTGDVDNVQMHSLGALGHDPSNWSEARALSRDGQYVVGWSQANLAHDLAFRWSEATGMESMHDWLDRNGVSVGGLILTDATAISDDGLVIAGLMTVPGEGERAYIARVAPPPDPGPGPGPGAGLMDVEEYNRSLFSVTSVAHAGEFLTWLPMNGAHHRPLMQQGNLADGHCAWAVGDLGVHGASQTGLGLAEAGGCVELFGGAVTAGLGIGASHSWQQLALGGSSRLGGQYVVGEVDWQPDGTPLLLSVTGMLGGWRADIHRGYTNGGATAYSDGTTGVTGGVVRVRADWLEAATIGNTTINPWASAAFGQLHVNGFTESGGPFPARFAAQTLGSTDIRLGDRGNGTLKPDDPERDRRSGAPERDRAGSGGQRDRPVRLQPGRRPVWPDLAARGDGARPPDQRQPGGVGIAAPGERRPGSIDLWLYRPQGCFLRLLPQSGPREASPDRRSAAQAERRPRRWAALDAYSAGWAVASEPARAGIQMIQAARRTEAAVTREAVERTGTKAKLPLSTR